MIKSLYLFIVPLIVGAILCGGQNRARAQVWQGPTFREFVGTNQGSTGNSLNPMLGWDRYGFDFASAETANGTWSSSYVNNWLSNEASYESQGVDCLSFLGFMAPWAGPDTHGPPSTESYWTNYVTQSVADLHAYPYNQNLFQIWNEAYPSSSGYSVATTGATFWDNTFDNYMNDIHIPAANVIHGAGAKVVWGGWPGGLVSPNDFITMMNHYSAWSTIDVVDLHYFHWWDLNTIRTGAIAAGYPNLGYWQTENGWTTDPLYIPTEYPGALNWALTNGVWNAQDTFKYFYFADSNSGNKTLWTGLDGSTLSPHGLILQNMSSLLSGGVLASLPNVTCSALSSSSYIAGFQVGTAKDIVAVDMCPSDYSSHSSLTLSFPIPLAQIVKAERVDLDGSHVVNITSSLSANGNNTNLSVSARDASGSNALSWNSAVSGSDCALFYVRLTLTTSSLSTPFTYYGNSIAIPGTIDFVNYDAGGAGLGYFAVGNYGTANGYRSDGVNISGCTDSSGNGYCEGWNSPGQWLRYTVNVATAGTYSVGFRVANGTALTGCIDLMDIHGTNLTGSVKVAPTGGWQTWTTLYATATLPAGTDTLILYESSIDTNLNWMSFTSCPVANGAYTMTPAYDYSQLRMETYGYGTANDTNVELWSPTNGTNQDWIFTNQGGNLYQIAPAYDPTMRLDVNGGSSANGTNVDIYLANGTNAQLWSVVPSYDGGFMLEPQCATGSCLDAVSWGTANNTNVDIWSNSGGSNQTWLLGPG